MRKLLLLCSLMLAGYVAGAQCVASFTTTASPQNNALLRIQFNNGSSWGLPFSGQQRFATIYYGDGNFASVGTTSPVYTYASPGTYTVSLVVRSVDSASGSQICKDSIAKTVTVAYPTCGSTISVAGTGKTKTFNASTPSGASGMTYNWDFGDGNTGTGAGIVHTYANNGTYTVVLTATQGSPATCTYTNTLNVVVYTPPPALLCATLNASFTTSVTNNVVSVTNTSSVVSSSYQRDVYWNWGDGSPVVLAPTPPPHTYSAIGAYTITAQVYWHDSLYTTSCYDTAMRTVAISVIPPPANIISGNVFYNVSLGTNYFKVWLIKLDTSTNILSAVDSQITANTAAPYFSFAGKASGSYRLKAAVHLGSTGGTGLIPTYHDSSVYWSTAKVINHTGGSAINRHIYMLNTGTGSAGPGFIGGNVSLGANKGSATGASDLLIFLRNATTKVVQTTLTDASGNYSFANIPLGAYSIWPERINYETIPVTPIVINTANPSKDAVNFNQDDARLSIKPRSPLDIPVCMAGPGLYIQPIPAQHTVTVTWIAESDNVSQFVITNTSGQVVGRSEMVRGKSGNVEMNVSMLSHGVYFLHGTGALAGRTTKLVIQ